MPGLYGYVRVDPNEQNLALMRDILSYEDRVLHDPPFADDHIEASRAHIGKVGLKTSPFQSPKLTVWVHGECYNLTELNNFLGENELGLDALIAKSYGAGKLDALLRQVNGPFCAVLYDREKKQIHIVTERNGFCPIFIYHKDGRFAWCGEIKGLLALDFVDRTINRKAVDCFMAIGYVLEDMTWFDHIAVPPSASITTYDLQTKNTQIRHYFHWNEIEQRDVSFDQARKDLADLSLQAVKKCINPGERIGIPLSGGLDSRFLVAAMQKLYPDQSAYLMTFGQKGCDDFTLSKRVNELTGWKHDCFALDEKNWFEPRKEAVWRTDGLLNLMHMHGIEFVDHLRENADIFLHGYAGDTILGGGFLTKENLDQRISHYNARSFYGDKTDLIKIDGPFYDLPHSEPHIYDNRCRRFTALGTVNAQTHVEFRLPFMDMDLMNYVYSMPDHYRKNNRIYGKILMDLFPNYYKTIPWQKTGKTIDKPMPNKFLLRVKGKFKRTLNQFGLLDNRYDYANYAHWLRQPEKAEWLRELLDRSNAEYAHHYDVNLRETYLEPHLRARHVDKSDKILRGATMELYFRQVFRGSDRT